MPENPRKHHVSSRAKTVANRRIGLSAKEIKFLFIYSNIAHHGVPLSVIDGASRNPSEGEGHRFESCRVRHFPEPPPEHHHRNIGRLGRSCRAWTNQHGSPASAARERPVAARFVGGWAEASIRQDQRRGVSHELCGRLQAVAASGAVSKARAISASGQPLASIAASRMRAWPGRSSRACMAPARRMSWPPPPPP